MMAAMALRGSAPSPAAGAVEALFVGHYRSLVRLAVLLLGDRQAAEEVVQDAFVRLQISWPRLRDPERAPAWLRSVVLNGARSRLRGERVRRRHLDVVPGLDESPEAGAVAADEHRRMVAALGRLPQRQREALILKFYLELSEAETAAAMGVSAGSVKTHVHRGLARLAELVEVGS